MAGHLRLLLILCQLTGIYSISKVSVKAGDSITIPCPYQSRYTNRVKYLCKGYFWESCSFAVKTNKPDRSGKFSISDDKNEGIFTVTIKSLTATDTDYWCNVEINHGADHGEYFQLVVTGKPSLYVDRQEIKGYIGDDLAIRCYHGSSGKMQWCTLGRNCVTGPRGKIDGKEVTINSTIPHVSTVTMSKVTRQSSGWYLCVQGDLQMPVHVTVTERPVIMTSTPLFTSGSGDGETAQHSSVLLMSLIIPLSLLIVVVMVTLFIFLMLKKQRTRNSQSPNMATSSCGSDGDVLYSSVLIKTKPQKDEAKGQVKAQDEHLTYSTLKNSHS
ncbi:polymeric immunoglobulin receptor-like [Solea senegalensis]|uniref:polymeric immunoglobulin receptor-like isoform X1 n=1 Tax=Solea senegalensis TaxID=28829 RepID=UPI001C41D5C7|nr:polymeric immunoglobulin receptor-like isoform X1 [Solea senegalensis]KAG7512711.1 polymeric immunoglobulin receptor-like [Solea senegalensis]